MKFIPGNSPRKRVADMAVMVNRVLNRAFDAARWEKTAVGQEWVRKIEYRLVA